MNTPRSRFGQQGVPASGPRPPGGLFFFFFFFFLLVHTRHAAWHGSPAWRVAGPTAAHTAVPVLWGVTFLPHRPEPAWGNPATPPRPMTRGGTTHTRRRSGPFAIKSCHLNEPILVLYGQWLFFGRRQFKVDLRPSLYYSQSVTSILLAKSASR